MRARAHDSADLHDKAAFNSAVDSDPRSIGLHNVDGVITTPSPLFPDSVIIFVRYIYTELGPVPGQIGLRLPMFCQVLYYPRASRHNVITWRWPLFAAPLSQRCVRLFINSTL